MCLIAPLESLAGALGIALLDVVPAPLHPEARARIKAAVYTRGKAVIPTLAPPRVAGYSDWDQSPTALKCSEKRPITPPPPAAITRPAGVRWRRLAGG